MLQFDKKITLRLIVHDEILNSHMQNVTTFFFKTVTKHFLKGVFFSESAIRFSNLQISKIKVFQITILSLKFKFPANGGFQLLDFIIPELKSHVIPYKFKSSD